VTVDPLNKHDRSLSAHMLYFGPTGAGKSATLRATLSQLMAIHRSRLFIAEAGINGIALSHTVFDSDDRHIRTLGTDRELAQHCGHGRTDYRKNLGFLLCKW